MAVLIRTDGSLRRIDPKDPARGFTCEEIYAHIGNGCDTFEYVPNVFAHGILCDEEGKLRRPAVPVNEAATLLFKKYLLPGDVLVGNIIVLTNPKELQ